MTEVRYQKTEVRSQMSENRRQVKDDRGQMTEVRSLQKTDEIMRIVRGVLHLRS